MLSEGQILEGKYRVERLLSQGGMGAVFVGQHTTIKRKVAIKILHEKGGANADTVRRFEKEAQAAGQIGSDHIVEVLDLGNTADGDRFMVMEFLDGETLTARIKAAQRLTPADAVPLIVQLLEGLGAAHAAGIVHRDLKPDNIFILKEKAGRRDFVKIVDFGVSKFASLEGEAGQATKDGTVMGTPFYMSPEQARSANEADARSDLYSVGVILFEAITGAVPFRATTFADLLFKIVFEEPPHPTSLVPHLDPEFAALVMKAMARDPHARFQTARELQTALHQWIVRHAAGGSVSHPGSAPQHAAHAVSGHASGNHVSVGNLASGPMTSGGVSMMSQPSRSAQSYPQGQPVQPQPAQARPSVGSHPSSGSHSSPSFPSSRTEYMPEKPVAPATLPFAHRATTGAPAGDDDTTTKPGAPMARSAAVSRQPPTQGSAQHPYGSATSQLGQDTHKAWDASSQAHPGAAKKGNAGLVVAAAVAAMVLGVVAAVWLYKQPAAKDAPSPATSAVEVAPTSSASAASGASTAPTAEPVASADTATPGASGAPSASVVPPAAPLATSSGKPGGAPPGKSPGNPGGAKPPPSPAPPGAPPAGPGNVKDYGY